MLSLQQGGVVLATPHDLRGDADAVRHDAADVRAESVLDRWEQAMTTLATPVPFTVDGPGGGPPRRRRRPAPRR
ncbi:hypothetical protein V8017_03735 [Stenotrophomonas rhizophila]